MTQTNLTDIIIEVQHLSKTFKSFKKGKGLLGTFKTLFKRETVVATAVNDISFTIKKGEIIVRNGEIV